MHANNDYQRSAADRALRLRARGDVQLAPVAFAGQGAYVVKDPLTLDVFHLSPEEGFLLKALRTPTSLVALQRKFAEWFAPRKVTTAQLHQFLSQLYELGLIVSDQPGQGVELSERGRQRQRRERWTSALHLLAIRLGGVDAHAPIDRLYAAVRWAFHPLTVFAAVATMLYAALLLIGNAAEVSARLPALADLARPGHWPIWIAALAGVKLLHELGHALACRHFGGRCREVGVMLLAFAPTLYCDVSDVWRLPGKWQRIAVSAAGMAVELFIAAVASILWWHAEPGLLNSLCLSTAIVCSVGTLLVNANPLLRYDGYYMLADWLEVPNLAERSRGVIGGRWRRWLLGEAPPDDQVVGPRMRKGIAFYAVAAKLYLTLVLIGIFTALLAAARPARLENLVYTLATITALSLLLRPVLAATKILRNPSLRSKIRWPRMIVSGAVLGAALVGVLCVPIKRQVVASATIVPAHAQPVFAKADGELIWAVEPSSNVEAGDVIATLANPQLELAVTKLEGEVEVRRLRYQQLQRLRVTQPALAEKVPTAAAELADAEAQLIEHRQQAERLTVRAERSGRILAPPEREAEQREATTLGDWTGSPLDRQNRGAWIEAATPLAVVAGDDRWRAWAAVDPRDVAAVEVGQPVRISLEGWPTHVLSGSVRHIAQRATNGDDDAIYHVVEIDVDPGDVPLHSGSSGRIKIETHASTVGEKLMRQVRRVFRTP